MIDNTPILSVRLMTFNHEKYIDRALKGVFMQQTSFLIEVVIGDDFSEDKTIEIVKKYKRTKFIDIRILCRPQGGKYQKIRKSKGRGYNFYDIIQNCKGKYIALLDGDDYWTDSLKLEKQVNFLENNEDYSLCFHQVNMLMPDGVIRKFNKSNYHQYSQESFRLELINFNFIPSCSVVYRKINFEYDIFENSPVYDYPLYLELLEKGKIGYIIDVMGIYRIHGNGMWSGKKRIEKLLQTKIFSENIIPRYLKTEEHFRFYYNKMGMLYYDIFIQYSKQRVFSKALVFLLKSIKYFMYSNFFNIKPGSSKTK